MLLCNSVLRLVLLVLLLLLLVLIFSISRRAGLRWNGRLLCWALSVLDRLEQCLGTFLCNLFGKLAADCFVVAL